MINKSISAIIISSLIYALIVTTMGCAQIGFPTGGIKDTLSPIVINANPKLNSTQVNSNKITLTFNEYIELKDVSANVLVSPYQKINPVIDSKLKTVTIKLKDSLQTNTTYNINFGNAIVDINERNALKNFSYIFSTGKTIDSLQVSGSVHIAETDKVDSTIIVLLYKNLNDTAVQNFKPNYIAKVDGNGNFIFSNLPSNIYHIYALKDGDGSKTYNSKNELFAFSDKTVQSSISPEPVSLNAFALEKIKPNLVASSSPNVATKVANKLKYTIKSTKQDLLGNFELEFNKPLKTFNKNKIQLFDSSNKTILNYNISIDSNRKKISIVTNWIEEMNYKLIIDTTAFIDSNFLKITKIDTIKFSTKKISDYGSLTLRVSNLEINKKPVLQFVQNDEVKFSFPLIANEWSKKLFNPGDYDLRILYDQNGNGIWDSGNFKLKIQPEKVIAIKKKINVRANWDNENDIKL